MKTLIVFSIFIIEPIIGLQPNVQAVINGTDTQLGEAPFMAGIRRYNQDIFCGGVLISDQHILTSPHCAKNYTKEDLTVLLGKNDLLSAEQFINIEEMKFSDDASIERPIGIAVLTLTTRVKFSTLISNIPLPKIDAPENASAILTGFGYQIKDVENGHMSPILQKLNVRVINQAKCIKLLENKETVLSSHLCGYTAPNYGACHGDSGSPLVYNRTVVGIALSVYPDCAEGYPDVYARITYYLSFIRNITHFQQPSGTL